MSEEARKAAWDAECFKAFISKSRTTEAGNTVDYEIGFFEGWNAHAEHTAISKAVKRYQTKAEHTAELKSLTEAEKAKLERIFTPTAEEIEIELEEAEHTAQIAALRSALEEALEPGVFGLQDRSKISAPEDAEIRAFGERIGFGALMDGASRMWAIVAKEKGLAGSEFTVGTCAATHRKWIKKAEQALAASDGS